MLLKKTMADNLRTQQLEQIVTEKFEQVLRKAQLCANRGLFETQVDYVDLCVNVPGFERRFFVYACTQGFLVTNCGGVFTLKWTDEAFLLRNEFIQQLNQIAHVNSMRPEKDLHHAYLEWLGQIFSTNNLRQDVTLDVSGYTTPEREWITRKFSNDGFRCTCHDDVLHVDWHQAMPREKLCYA